MWGTRCYRQVSGRRDPRPPFMAPFQVYEFAFACCSIAAAALLIWDHVITLGAEVNKIWSRKLSGSTVLYALLRYGTLFEKITVLFLASWYLTPHGCDIAVRVQIFPMILRTLGFGLFSSLRVLALSNRNWALAISVFLLCLPSAITPAYVYTHQDSPAVDRYGCQLAYLASATVHDRLRIGGIIADILSETIAIVVTINRTFGLRNSEIPFEGKRRPGLALILLRDGTIYFTALLLLSLADMLVLIFDHVPEFATRYDYWVVPYYTPVFRTIIICRFLLMLRAIYFDDKGEPGDSALNHSIHFASRVIGSMGAPVDATRFDEDSDVEDEDIVYSGDPLITGLAMMCDSEAPAPMEGDKEIPLRQLIRGLPGSEVDGERV
ncbi:hypothetical protein B0H17DRAFT_1337261 [Mycena rosella]|uniref:DUF6533 domain-containing protein n=1 Tax=Mycena rosella TaxID=1033263 RepID=A0AAD7CSS7_MYCRO|nr:hypothetical protein B0H17DRAFT_1337261 [Mycena rosella]